jgi:primosomal protein N' (replication factor Y)
MALAEREQAQLPPFSAQALLRAESLQADAPQQFLEAARQAAAEPPDGLQFWGPAPAPMERRAGRYRAHLLIQSATRAQLQAYLKPWMSALYRLKQARQVRWSLDVDPREMI